MEIRDPNTKDAAKITPRGLLRTYAVIEVEQLYVNENEEEAYTMDLDNVVIDADGSYLVSIQSASDKMLVVTSINLWQAQSKDDSNLEIYLGGTLASAGTAVVTPTNCNAGSGHAAEGTFYVNDNAGNMTVTTTGIICGRHKFTANFIKWNKRSGWILPKNSVMNIIASKDNTFRGYISFYYHDPV